MLKWILFYKLHLLFFNIIGKISNISVLIIFQGDYWHGIPSVMFGTMGIISGLLVLTQPETLGTAMPDTLEEAEALGVKKSNLDQVS